MSDDQKERIGFIGAGMMGSGICANLLKAGFPLNIVAHRNRERIEALVAQGATEAASRNDLIANSDILMTCVNSADTVSEIIEGVMPVLRPGMLVIDLTTSLPEVSRQLATRLADRNVAFVDAPINGGPAQAAAGNLGTFVGGSDRDVARSLPMIRTYSDDFAHFGNVGAGHTAKLLNNFLTVGLRQLVTHAFRAARRNDIDLEKLYNLTMKGAAGSRTLEQLAGGAIAMDFTRNKFSIANCYKDMSYAEGLMRDDPDGLALQQTMRDAYKRLVDAGLGDHFASEMLDPEIEAQVKQT